MEAASIGVTTEVSTVASEMAELSPPADPEFALRAQSPRKHPVSPSVIRSPALLT